MRTKICALALLCFITSKLYSQVFPGENAKLHYRIIGFSVNTEPGAEQYILQVAKGSHTEENLFKNNIILSDTGKGNKVLAKMPEWGQEYTWRVMTKNKKGTNKGTFYHFSTLKNALADTHSVRLNISKNTGQFNDHYIFMDYTQAMYDMNGDMVWFLPEHLCPGQNMGDVADLKMNAAGTITFIYYGSMYEIDYNGNLLQCAPKPDTLSPLSGGVHHDSYRMAGGHLMVCNGDALYLKKPETLDTFARDRADTNRMYYQFQFGTVLEYDAKGNVVWKWSSWDHFRHCDIPDSTNAGWRYLKEVHMNALFFDEKKKEVYVGFRNLNRIVKVKYPEGDVITEFGRKMSQFDTSLEQDLFCQQHSILAVENQLFVYNNNSCNDLQNPSLLILKEAANEPYGLKKVWEYRLGPEIGRSEAGNGRGAHGRKNSRGGNMLPLHGGCIFAALNSPHSGMIIVDRSKQVLWKASIEKWDEKKTFWRKAYTYRANVVQGREDLEKLVWHGIR